MHPVVWIAIGVAGLGLLFGANILLSRRDLTGIKDPKDRHEIKTANRDLFIKIVGGVGLVGTLVFTGVAAFNGIEGVELSRRTLDDTQKAQDVDRYTKAVEQLGSDNQTVRIGGVYALQSLLGKPEHHQAAVDLLASFIRTNATPPAAGPAVSPPAEPFDPTRGSCDERPPPMQPPADIQIAMHVLARRDSSGERGRLDLRGAYLAGLELPIEANLVAAQLDQANLAYARLQFAKLETASLVRTDLQYACLHGAHADGAQTGHAIFEHAILTGAKFGGSDFSCARMRGAALLGTWLQGNFLRGTELQEAFLQGVHLERGSLDRVDVTGAHFEEAHLEGTSLERTNGITDAQIESAHTDEKTQRPLRTQPWWPPNCSEGR